MRKHVSLWFQLRYPLFALFTIVSLLALHGGTSSKSSTASVSPGARTVMITGIGFLPATLHCRQGETVTLVITNTDRRPHHFAIRDLAASTVDLQPGQTASITVSAVKKGLFSYVSDIGGTPEPGYCGVLTVE